MASEWGAGEVAIVGGALEGFGKDAGDLVLNAAQGKKMPASMISTMFGLGAAFSDLYGIGLLMRAQPVPAIAVLTLARSSIESMGRSWRMLEPKSEEERDTVAAALRTREVDRARFNGLKPYSHSGRDLEEYLATLKAERNDKYAETAIRMLRKSGAPKQRATAMYSFMSGVAHGESLSIEDLWRPLGDGHAYILLKPFTKELAYLLLQAANHTLGRYLEVFAPGYLHELAQLTRTAQSALKPVFAGGAAHDDALAFRKPRQGSAQMADDKPITWTNIPGLTLAERAAGQRFFDGDLRYVTLRGNTVDGVLIPDIVNGVVQR